MKTNMSSGKLPLFVLLMTFALNLSAGGPFESGYTLKFGYVLPASDFGKFSDEFGKLPKPDFQYRFKAANNGYALHLGSMYFLEDVINSEKFCLGIDVTWVSFNYQYSSYEYTRIYDDDNVSHVDDGKFDAYYVLIYPEVGPFLSFSPGEKTAFDLSIKASPTVGFTGFSYELSIGDDEKAVGAGFGMRFTPALYFRFGILLLGFEYNYGDIKYSYDPSGFDLNEKTATLPSSTSRLVLGFKF